ncbi:PIN-like domain-containing protein [Bryobacter aggregatus]|uniref:PIN-like domain-containing protein n=1 Tax=Bryobacter aggregatus TaxID=360054 RepID=UPI0004E2673F|nr:PIN-like domain-containing protein [Bryobacter aggregatus]
MNPLLDEFREYCPLTADEMVALSSPLYVFDSNALLEFYRYSRSVRDEFISVLKQLRHNLFIPYQVALDFHRNRVDVIAELQALGDQAIRTLDEKLVEVKNAIEEILTHKQHSSTEKSDLLAAFQNQLIALRETVVLGAQQHDATFSDDPVLNAVHELIEGRIGPPLSEEELEFIPLKNEGERTDHIVWQEILSHGREAKRAVILVTTDDKRDWIWRSHGKEILIRPDLRRQFHEVVGQPVWSITPEFFLEVATERLAQPMEDLPVPQPTEVILSKSTGIPCFHLESKQQTPLKLVANGPTLAESVEYSVWPNAKTRK